MAERYAVVPFGNRWGARGMFGLVPLSELPTTEEWSRFLTERLDDGALTVTDLYTATSKTFQTDEAAAEWIAGQSEK